MTLSLLIFTIVVHLDKILISKISINRIGNRVMTKRELEHTFATETNTAKKTISLIMI
jgi:hypothetical protein